MSSQMVQPTEYDLDYVKLTSHSGKEVNLKLLFQEINIYVSLFTGTMTAAILLTDATNLPNNLPILGGEDVELRYRTAGRQAYTTLKFKIGSIGDRHPIQGEGLAYWLNLLTPEAYRDASVCVSQHFSGVYSELIKKVPGLLGSTKKVSTNGSVGLADFVSPQWSPLKLAKFMASRASDSGSSPFYFWEDIDGYHFRSLADLYTQTESREYFYEPNDQRDDKGQRDMVKKFLNIERMEITRSNDKVNQNRAGAFEQELVTFDLCSKTIDRSQCVASGAGVDKHAVHDDQAGTRTKVGFTLTKSDDSHASLFQRTSSRHFLGNTKLLALIPGDDEMRIGHVVNYRLPSHEPQAGEKLKEDRLLAGRWLVSGMKHTLSKQQYKISMELSKDSFGSTPLQ